jgi:Flp pilus assembly protein TadD
MPVHFEQVLECFQLGQWEDTERLARQLLAETPEFVPALQVLAMTLAQQGRASEARDLLQRATQLQPQSAEAWINLGNACLECADLEGADAAFGHARTLGAGDEVAYLLGHGLTLLGNGNYVDAQILLKAAFEREPDAPDVRLAHAQCLSELERFDDLAQCLQGLDADALDQQQQRALAWLLAQAGRDEAALLLYRRLLETAPDDELRIQLALLLERLNRVEDAADALAAVAHQSTTPMRALCAARVLRRQGEASAAVAELSAALALPMTPAMQAQLQFELAKCHGQQAQVDAAMQALARAHAAAAEAFGQRSPAQASAPVLGWLQQRLHKPMPAHWQTPVADALPDDPVFLVGFPRSGTTLLERMLDGHRQLDVLDERPALEVMIEQLRSRQDWQDDDLDASLERLAPAQVQQARQKYWQEVGRHLQPRGRLVDKYPLTMTRLPYVARMFPSADWLLLLRHPCDCVLSCHMQAFGINGGALAFASLESTARTYAAVMRWWDEQRQRAPARVHVLRYEDLVQDVPAQLEALMAFLSLTVEPEQLASHHASAARSRRINTPSYAQVVKPVNAAAVGRWERYRVHFSQATLDVLAPWVTRYGYRLD